MLVPHRCHREETVAKVWAGLYASDHRQEAPKVPRVSAVYSLGVGCDHLWSPTPCAVTTSSRKPGCPGFLPMTKRHAR